LTSKMGDPLVSSEVVANTGGVVVRHADILELRWLPATAGMTDGGFMATLCLFAHEAEHSRPRGLFIDATQFRHRFANPEAVMAWRDAHIIPRDGAPRIRPVAFLMPTGVPDTPEGALAGPAHLPTTA